MRRTIKYTLFFAQIFWAGILYLYFIEKDFLIGLFVERVTVATELQWGAQVFEEQRDSLELLEDPELKDFLERLIRPLYPVLQASPYPIRFHLSRSLDINAFALPGAHIIINAGLVLSCEKPEELLAVLAHEIAHVNNRDNLERWIYQAGFMAFLGKEDKETVNAAFVLSALSYSRAQELEADRAALVYLRQARISPHGLEVFLSRMEEAERKQGENQPTHPMLLSTHPATQERIRLVQETLIGDKAFYYQQPFPYEGFQHRLKAKLIALHQRQQQQPQPQPPGSQ